MILFRASKIFSNHLLLSSHSPGIFQATVKLVLSRIETEGTSKVYQGATLLHYDDETFFRCSKQVLEDLQNLSESIKHRLAWSDIKLLRSILAFLDTRSWTTPRIPIDSVADDKAEIREAMEYIVTVFREPLEAKDACIFSLQDELDEIVDFYRKYLENQAEGYRKVWYKLFTAHGARKWPNVILVSELIFSLPFTNSRVERAFSTMKIVKTNRRTSLLSSTLDDLMEISAEGPELENFSADHAVQLWWSDRLTKLPGSSTGREDPRLKPKAPTVSQSWSPSLLLMYGTSGFQSLKILMSVVLNFLLRTVTKLQLHKIPPASLITLFLVFSFIHQCVNSWSYIIP